MASIQSYKPSEENLQDNITTRGFLAKPSTERYQYKKSTSLSEKVKEMAQSARNKLHHHHHNGLGATNTGNPVISHPHNGLQVPNKGHPVQNGLQVPNKGHPVANYTQNGLQVPNKGYPVASPTQNGLQVPNKGLPVASNVQNGWQVPNKGYPIASPTQNGSNNPNKGQLVVSQHVQKPEYDPFHVASYQYANTGNKDEGHVLPTEKVHEKNSKEENYDSETESSSDSDNETASTNKGHPVASQAQKPVPNTHIVASNNYANTEKKKDEGQVFAQQSLHGKNDEEENYDSETDSDSDTDRTDYKKKY